ncbi:hypothetical protein [Sphaerimonospora thailandensis]|uniref:Protein kinase domain-containing protein n=1 Tax=Sphaerimonospora thailandensis TaxID=795644 RepID=A0A8J3RCZ2_9ACTN|nr:hypothetical protein [Sphaerimonospora thailandensis]GIH72315.1 hypothetical protein Mth01_45680 [Sphaerimonospora thailandensis]
MSWPDGSDLQLGSLSLGDKLGMGGQGAVYDFKSPRGRGLEGAGYVYKEYLQPAAVNAAALADLVALPGRMASNERDRLLAQAAWPLARVLNGNRVTGFIMAKVPSQFWGEATAGRKLREAQYLMFEPKPLWGDIVPPDAGGRLEVARRAASLFQLLHANRLIVGDVSMRNLLWSPSPVGIFLLDCDGARVEGRSPVMRQPETIDWDDPLQLRAGPDQDTDRYKLALLIVRILTRDHGLRPGTDPRFVPGLPDPVVQVVTKRFKEAAGPRGTRPDAARWAMALMGRDIIELDPPGPVRKPPTLPKAPMDQPGRRFDIDLTSQAGGT